MENFENKELEEKEKIEEVIQTQNENKIADIEE